MYLETVTGRLVNVVEPSPDQISIEDIAWGLSRIARFCGSTITAVPYNVAQHCIFVAEEIKSIFDDPSEYKELAFIEADIRKLAQNEKEPGETILLGLIHDAAEVYIGDIPSPVKRIPELRPIIKKVESSLMSAIYLSFSLPEPSNIQKAIVEHADKIAQRVEAHAFMQSRGNHWQGLPTVSLEKLQKFEAPLPSLDAYKIFMEYFNFYFDKYKSQTILAK